MTIFILFVFLTSYDDYDGDITSVYPMGIYRTMTECQSAGVNNVSNYIPMEDGASITFQCVGKYKEAGVEDDSSN